MNLALEFMFYHWHLKENNSQEYDQSANALGLIEEWFRVCRGEEKIPERNGWNAIVTW